jgi:hypothetical protein
VTTPVAGTWLEETLARALHEAFGDHDSEACLDGYDLEHARSLIATPAGQSLAARIAALEAVAEAAEDLLPLSVVQKDHQSYVCTDCDGDVSDGRNEHHGPDCVWVAFRAARARWLAVRGGASGLT